MSDCEWDVTLRVPLPSTLPSAVYCLKITQEVGTGSCLGRFLASLGKVFGKFWGGFGKNKPSKNKTRTQSPAPKNQDKPTEKRAPDQKTNGKKKDKVSKKKKGLAEDRNNDTKGNKGKKTKKNGTKPSAGKKK